MRLLHVVTLVSPDGAFGGPLRVALNDCQELQRRGHEVLLAAGWLGGGPPPASLEDIQVRLFPTRATPKAGFSGMLSPGLQTWLGQEAKNFDAVHVHLGRDLITQLAARRLRGLPYVVQTHGMIPPKQNAVARMWDRLLTRPSLEQAQRRYVLNQREAHEMQGQFPPLRFELLPNGVATPPPPPADPVTSDESPEVLFLARLQSRKRPDAFVEMARQLCESGTDARFVMIGPDEGELHRTLARIRDVGLADRVSYEGALPYSAILDRLRRATVYVLPSIDEPFPMSLLEAMSVGIPCVTTTSCGIADQIQELEAALIVDPDPAALALAVDGLLRDREYRERLALNARRAISQRFSIAAVADTLEREYAGLVRASH